MIFDIENWLWKSNCGTFDTFPLQRFSKFNHFPWICWFLDKNFLTLYPSLENLTTHISILLSHFILLICYFLVYNSWFHIYSVQFLIISIWMHIFNTSWWFWSINWTINIAFTSWFHWLTISVIFLVFQIETNKEIDVDENAQSAKNNQTTWLRYWMGTFRKKFLKYQEKVVIVGSTNDHNFPYLKNNVKCLFTNCHSKIFG